MKFFGYVLAFNLVSLVSFAADYTSRAGIDPEESLVEVSLNGQKLCGARPSCGGECANHRKYYERVTTQGGIQKEVLVDAGIETGECSRPTGGKCGCKTLSGQSQ